MLLIEPTKFKLTKSTRALQITTATRTNVYASNMLTPSKPVRRLRIGYLTVKSKSFTLPPALAHDLSI